jgi:uncharacterized membrane protein YkvA (DUF1232 family)
MIVPHLPSPITLSEPEGEKTARDERVVATGFWPKIRATLGKVPFSEDAVAGYFCATDRRTPAHVRGVLFGALAYFVMPADMIPDFIAGLGFTDDATVLLAAISAVRGYISEAHRSQARAFLFGAETPDH